MKNPKHILFLGTCLLWYSSNTQAQSISSLCPNTALVPVFMQDFGQGASPTSTSKAPAGSTNYGFGSVGTDGNYILTPLVNNANKSDWTKGGDHTGILNGNMFLVNAGGGNSIFFKQIVTGLCPGSSFNFSAWLANVNTSSTLGICGAGLVYPKVIFNIKDLSGTILGTVTTGKLPLSPVNGPANWNQYGFQFSLPAGVNSLILEMVDFYGGAAACGNDLALDDIVFSACTPMSSISLSTPSAICAGSNTKIISTTINSPYTSPAYQFQKSIDNGNTWQNIGTPSVDSTTFFLNNVQVSDSGKYRVIVGPDIASLGSSTCITSSNVISLTVYANPILTVNSNSPVCEGSSLTLLSNVSASASASPFTFSWTGPDGFSSIQSNPVINNVNLSNTGNYNLNVIDVNGCSVSNTISVTVNQRPSLFISNHAMNICSGSATQIDFNTNIPGSVYSWRSIPLSGTINGNSNPLTGTPVNSLHDTLFNSANIPALIKYEITVTTASGCNALNYTMVSIYPKPDIPFAGHDQALCNATSTLLNANNPVIGTGIWSYISGPSNVTFSDSTVFNSHVNGLIKGKYLLSWAISSSNCPVLRDTISITILGDLPTAKAGPDQTFCNTSNILLNADTTASQYGKWSELSGPTAVIFSNAFSPSTDVTGLSSGNYQFIWTLSNGACADTKDTVNITILPTIINANAGADQILCNTNTVNLSGNIPTSGTGSWALLSGASTVNILNKDSASTSVSGLVPGIYLFSWTIRNTTCTAIADTIQITISQPITIANAGMDQTLCITSSAFLNGNLPTVGSGSWSLLAGPSAVTFSNTSSPTSNVTGLITGSYQFVWSISNGICSASKDTVIIKILPAITIANAGVDQILCNANTVNLTGNIPSSGNGVWFLISGPSAVNIVNKDSASTSVSGLVLGAYLFSWSIQNFTCDAIADTVQITISQPVTIANAGMDQTLCNTSTASLNGNLPAVGSGSWSLLAGPSAVTFSNTSSPTSNVTGLIAGSYQFVWSISNGICSASKDTVIIKILPTITIANAGVDQILCNSDSVNLSANVAAIGSGRWTVISGQSQLLFTNDTLSITTVKGLQSGFYQFVWTITGNGCNSSADTVNVQILPPISNKIDTNNIRTCAGTTQTIKGKIGSGGNNNFLYQWEKSLDGIHWKNIIGATDSVYTFFADSTYRFRRMILSGNCISESEIISVIVYPTLSSNMITANQEFCFGQSMQTIVGSIPIGADGNYTYQWEMSDDSLQWKKLDSAIGIHLYPININDHAYFRRLVTNNICNASTNYSNLVSVKVRPLPIATLNVSSKFGCTPFSIDSLLVKNIIHQENTESYQWLVNGQLLSKNEHFPGMVLQKDSVTIKLIAVSKYGCRPDTASATFIVPPKLNIAFSLSDTVGCGPLTVNFNNQTANPSQNNYQWNLGNGLFSNLEQPLLQTYNASLSGKDTSYVISLRAQNSCEMDSIERKITIKRKGITDLSVTTLNSCSPMNVAFQNLSVGDNTSYRLIFGDGLDTLINANSSLMHTYHTGINTNFLALLRAQNECGIDSLIIPIKALPNPVHVSIKLNDTAVCGAPFTLQLQNQTTAAKNMKWEWGDGSPAVTTSLPIPLSHTYQNPGSYLIVSTVSSGCSDSAIFKPLEIYPSVKTTAAAIVPIACIGETISFQNLSDTLLSFSWNLGDGTISAERNLQHGYKTFGVFQTTLKTWSTHPQITCSDSTNLTIQIIKERKGKFLLSDSTGRCLPFRLRVYNTNGPSSKTAWNWGDGTNSSGDSSSHIYKTAGRFLVTMHSESIGGCVYTDSAYVTILSPTVQLSYKGGVYCTSANPIEFRAITDRTDSVRWEFGDGTTEISSLNKTTHSYQRSGTYLPKLQLISQNGTCIIPVSASDTILIDEVKADIQLSAIYDCGKTSYRFIESSQSYFSIIDRNWTLNKNPISVSKEFQKTFTQQGQNETAIQVKTINGCTSSLQASFKVSIYQFPQANINAINEACLNHIMELKSEVSSIDSVNSRYWNLGNGTIATDSVVKVFYNNDGKYTIKLTVSTVNSCYDSAFKEITIHPKPTISMVPDQILCSGDSLTLFASGASSYIWKDLNNNVICANCTTTTVKPNKSTSFQVIGFSEFGCSNIASTIIRVIQPFKLLVTTPDTICVGDSKRLLVTGGSTYNWRADPGLSNINSATPIVSPKSTTTFHVTAKDSYKCFTDSADIKIVVGKPTPFNIGMDTAVLSGTPVQLHAFSNSNDIKKWQWRGNATFSCLSCEAPTAKVIFDECLNCTATNIYGCVSTDTVCIKTFCPTSEVFIPNAFSPDGDGINDVLIVQGRGLKMVKSFRIYNRWGELVFERSNFYPGDASSGWNGKVRGSMPSPDVFVYVCEVICERGVPATFKGNVAIIK